MYSVPDGLFSAGTLVQVQGQRASVQWACSELAEKFGRSVTSLPCDVLPEQYKSTFKNRLERTDPPFFAELEDKTEKWKAGKKKQKG